MSFRCICFNFGTVARCALDGTVCCTPCGPLFVFCSGCYEQHICPHDITPNLLSSQQSSSSQESLVNKNICRDDQSFSEHNPTVSLLPLFDTSVGESFANSTARNTSIATKGVEKRNEAGWLREKKRKFAELSKDNEENDYVYKGKDNEYDPIGS
jgi:hypothetical protein